MEIKESELLGINPKSDKILHHGYHRFYPIFLDKFTQIDSLRILELGYEDGYSIQLWKEYFKNPIIHSIDIIDDPNDHNVDAYFKIDQSNNDMLDIFCRNNTEKYHFIIDDASHIPNHQWNTFLRLFNILNNGGVYIIEDIETSFWGKSNFYGYKFNSNKTSIFKLVDIIHQYINCEFINWDIQKRYDLREIEVQTLSQIETCTIAYNCIIFTKKDAAKYSQFYRNHENYRFKNKINENQEGEILSRTIFVIKKLCQKIFK